MQKIVVFDSGIGGFSIVQEIVQQHLPLDIEYVGDQAFFPYGNKSSDWLHSRLAQVGEYYKDHALTAFVVACNTGTVEGITAIRSVLNCPVVGIEPVIKPLNSYEHALVLATPAAVESDRTQQLIREYGHHILVHGCVGLATAIENNDSEQMKNELDVVSEIVHREKVQAIGLSCTHYPLIKESFVERFPTVHLYDPSQAVVMHLKNILGITNLPHDVPTIQFQTTGEMIRFKSQVARYFGPGQRIGAIEI